MKLWRVEKTTYHTRFYFFGGRVVIGSENNNPFDVPGRLNIRITMGKYWKKGRKFDILLTTYRNKEDQPPF